MIKAASSQARKNATVVDRDIDPAEAIGLLRGCVFTAQNAEMFFIGPGGLRLILAAMVVESHYRHYAAWNPCDVIAVSAFFFLSGYWIAALWAAKYSRTVRPVLTFYVSRLWRILPLAMIGNLAAILLMPATAETIVRSTLLFGSAASQVGPADPPLWSIDVELQFYLLAPLLLVVLHRRPAAVALLVVGMICAYCHAAQLVPTTVLAGLVFFVLGILFAWRRPYKAMQRAAPYCLAVVVVAVGAIDIAFAPPSFSTGRLLDFPAGFVALPIVGATLAVKSTDVDRMLGDLAYPLYVIHFPIIYLVARLGLPHALAGVPLTAAATAALYLFVDRPLEKLRRGFVNRRHKAA